MADLITVLPFQYTAVDTSEHELEIDPKLLQDCDSLCITVTTGTYQFSKLTAIASNSGTYNATSSATLLMTLANGSNKFRVKATTIGDVFQCSAAK